MEKITGQLISFIDLAERNRKYQPNTAQGYKAALRRLEEVLNEDEIISFQLVEERFPQIMDAFFKKHQGEVSASSMDVYRKRIQKLLKDYKKWGPNLKDWSSWVVSVPKARHSSKDGSDTNPAIVVSQNGQTVEDIDNIKTLQNAESGSRYTLSTRFEIPLRPGVLAFVSTPSDLTKNEAKKIQKYVDYLIEISRED